MEQKWSEGQLIDYLLGELPIEKVVTLEADLKNSVELQGQCDDLEKLLRELEQLPSHRPSSGLQMRFDAMLAQEQQAEKPMRRIKLQYWLSGAAAAIALLVIGALIGLQISNNQQHDEQLAILQNELTQTKQVMFQLMQQDRTSSRIKAVNLTQQFDQPDPEIIEGLKHLLQQDDSPNVRLAAIDALLQFSQAETAREALINSLLMQKKPVVQIALIHALVQVDDPSALPYFDQMIESKEVLDKVKDEARLGQFKML